MPLWKLEEAGKTPAGAPFHPGAIKYLTERGIWTDTDSAWNEKRLAEIEASKKMWADALASLMRRMCPTRLACVLGNLPSQGG